MTSPAPPAFASRQPYFLTAVTDARRHARALSLSLAFLSAAFVAPTVAASQHQVEFNTDVGLVTVELSNGVRLSTDLATGDSLVTLPNGQVSAIPYSSLDATARKHIADITLAANRRENSFVMNATAGQAVDPAAAFSPMFPVSRPKSSAKTSSSGCLSHLPCTGSGQPSWTRPSPFPPADDGAWADPGNLPVTRRDLEDYDRERWQSEKDKACRNRDLALIGVAASGVAATLGCAASLSPAVITAAPVIICGAGLIGLAAAAVSAYDNHQECSVETYPGRGNW